MKANPIWPGSINMITRKIDQGTFRLSPTLSKRTRKDVITQIIGYIVAVAQKKFNVDIFALCVMSNHYHIYCRDNEGNLPLFAADVNRNIAQCLNAKQGTTGPVWNRDRCNILNVVHKRDRLKYLLYVMLNPVKAGLVELQRHWPGMVTKAKDFLKNGQTFKKPVYFFTKDGKMPEEATLVYTMLPGSEAADMESYVKFLEEKVSKEEKQIKKERGNKKALGRRRILKMNPFSKPKNGTKEHGLNPKIACSDKLLRIKYLALLKNWRIEYRKAWQEYKRGNKNVKFPYGTFKLALEHKVRVETGGCKEAEDLEIVLPAFA